MMFLRHPTVLLGLCMALAGCDALEDAGVGGDAAPPDSVGPEESFNWGGQPISFTPPGEGWERSREQSGGQEGIAFVKSGGMGTGISVVEMFAVGNRDRCAALKELRDAEIKEMTKHDVQRALQNMALFTTPLYYPGERELAKRANASIASARYAYGIKDYNRVRTALSNALGYAAKIRYSLDHCQELIEKDVTERKGRDQAVVTELVPKAVGGLPALTFDYSFYEDWRKTTFHGREVYVVANNRLFKVSTIGLDPGFEFFETVVGSIGFPEGDCRH